MVFILVSGLFNRHRCDDTPYMRSTLVGTLISACGYLLAIYGGWVLYQNAAPDHAYSTLFRGTGEEAIAFQQRQADDIKRRAVANPQGFLCLTVGAILQ